MALNALSWHYSCRVDLDRTVFHCPLPVSSSPYFLSYFSQITTHFNRFFYSINSSLYRQWMKLLLFPHWQLYKWHLTMTNDMMWKWATHGHLCPHALAQMESTTWNYTFQTSWKQAFLFITIRFLGKGHTFCKICWDNFFSPACQPLTITTERLRSTRKHWQCPRDSTASWWYKQKHGIIVM